MIFKPKYPVMDPNPSFKTIRDNMRTKDWMARLCLGIGLGGSIVCARFFRGKPLTIYRFPVTPLKAAMSVAFASYWFPYAWSAARLKGYMNNDEDIKYQIFRIEFEKIKQMEESGEIKIN